ncbi:DUF7916 family protein [Lacicoccus qingdaonensis]|uniref:DUF7916 domain-containing protein n=1 Tax=Lacicoccus qingdaonensis TaxID=576118 RepID=A0A1G9F7U1_9BACL|nr:PEP phosphonomutase [Salinicoccus qingdaonensis]SDK84497.1 hypothetical protein SAMN05216216_11123 [Salinicoccus qingdaonensis]
MKRLLDCSASDFFNMTGRELKQSIRASEGRVIMTETMTTPEPLYPDITNAELAASFGSDIVLLNLFDVSDPAVRGLDVENGDEVVYELKRLLGRPVGINLEPVDAGADAHETLDEVPDGRLASAESLERARELGFDFVCMTGNPKTGVTNEMTIEAIRNARKIFGDDGLIISGKMHGAGVSGESGGDIISEHVIEQFTAAGADIILMPAPGTVPGMTVDKAQKYVDCAHENGALALLTIGTSQEGADEHTIRQIALNSKMAGADMYHLGDTGYYGIAVPENIMTYSIAVRGRRHTYVRMGRSVNR